LLNSSLLLYQAHTLYFKILGVVLLAYLSYKLGRTTIVDPL
jgi:hypothetical protein